MASSEGTTSVILPGVPGSSLAIWMKQATYKVLDWRGNWTNCCMRSVEKVVAAIGGLENRTDSTDHGWLLMPGGLPKAELSSALTETKWRRFAALKSGASSGVRLVPWYWNPDRYVAIADGIRSFHLGMEYTHGGLSLQECLTLHLSVTTSTGSLPATTVSISNVTWQGLRCRVVLDGAYGGLQLDIRTQPETLDRVL